MESHHLPGVQVRTMVEGAETTVAIIHQRPVDFLMNRLLEGEPHLTIGVVAGFCSPVVVAHDEYIGGIDENL